MQDGGFAPDSRKAMRRSEGAAGVPLRLRERQAMVREFTARYVKATTSGRGRILDQAVQLLVCDRHHAARAVRGFGRPRHRLAGRSRRPGRRPIDDASVQRALRRVGAIMNFAAGKRLAPFVAEAVAALERRGG